MRLEDLVRRMGEEMAFKARFVPWLGAHID